MMAGPKTNLLQRIAGLLVRIAVPAIGVLLLLVILAWMAGTFHSKIPPGESPYARRLVAGQETVDVETLPITELVDAVGTVRARWKADVASQILATVKAVHIDPGSRVEAGQLLITLDDRELQTQLREAEAALRGIEADLAVQQRQLERYRQMYAGKAVSKAEFDRVKGDYDVTQAQVQRAKQEIERLQVMLTYTQIKAPAGGMVAGRYVDPGDLAAPGKPLLTLHDPSTLELHASVRENLTSDVRLGMKLPVQIDALNRQVTGVVREIVPQADTTSRSFLVKVTLPADQLSGLVTGMFGRLSVPVAKVEHIVVASDAVCHVGQLETVDVVVPDDGSLERRFIRTGRHFGDKTEVLSGLQVGETIVRAKQPQEQAAEATTAP
jgi:membrane fusion protein, multidrug efflux system